jgi:steroid delta-isomerase-like uncharacterized protein
MSEEIKELVLRVNDEVFHKGNLDLIDQVFATDYIIRGTEEVLSGPEIIKQFATEVRTAFPDLQVRIEILMVDGDKVSWIRRHTGTHQEEYLGIPATGRSVTWRTIIFSWVVDGKIKEEMATSDIRAQLQQVSERLLQQTP